MHFVILAACALAISNGAPIFDRSSSIELPRVDSQRQLWMGAVRCHTDDQGRQHTPSHPQYPNLPVLSLISFPQNLGTNLDTYHIEQNRMTSSVTPFSLPESCLSTTWAATGGQISLLSRCLSGTLTEDTERMPSGLESDNHNQFNNDMLPKVAA